jgi:heme exporter protein D
VTGAVVLVIVVATVVLVVARERRLHAEHEAGRRERLREAAHEHADRD